MVLRSDLLRTLVGVSAICWGHMVFAADVTIGPNGTKIAVSADAALAAKLPDGLRQGGALKIATDPSLPPYTYYAADGQTLMGADVDVGNAVAAKLGLKAEFSAIQFAGIIPAVEAGRVDTALSGMGDTPAREQKLDFVDYSTDGNAIIVAKGNPVGIKTITDLCGKRVAVLEGSVMLGLVEKQNDKCKDKIDVQIFQDINQALIQIRTGRADASMYQYGVAAYILSTSANANSLLLLSFEQYGVGYNAMPFRKADSAIRDAVQAALVDLKQDGTYQKILETWGMQANGLANISVNDGLRYNQPSN